jgi:hypothetical protein
MVTSPAHLRRANSNRTSSGGAALRYPLAGTRCALPPATLRHTSGVRIQNRAFDGRFRALTGRRNALPPPTLRHTSAYSPAHLRCANSNRACSFVVVFRREAVWDSWLSVPVSEYKANVILSGPALSVSNGSNHDRPLIENTLRHAEGDVRWILVVRRRIQNSI